MKKGCKYDGIRDYKGRTPLHVAAELGKTLCIEMTLCNLLYVAAELGKTLCIEMTLCIVHIIVCGCRIG